MSLAFELPKDKVWREDNTLQPYKIVSLWELMEFFEDAGKLYAASLRLTHLLRPHDVGKTDQSQAIPFDGHVETKERIDFLCQELERIRFLFALDCARELRRVIYDQIQEGPAPAPGRWMVLPPEVVYRYQACARDLAKTLQRELSNRTVGFFPPERVGYYCGSETIFSERARTRFPSVQGEMNEAGKCFALDRNAACMFHLMRVMEQTVKKLGTKFGVPRTHKKTWGKILRKIKGKIDVMGEDTVAQKVKKQKYYRTYDVLYSICEGIRNPLVHPVITDIDMVYTDEDVRNTIDRVKVFINDFAEL